MQIRTHLNFPSACCLLFGMIAVAGCSLPGKIKLSKNGEPQYNQLDLNYEMADMHRLVGSSSASAVEPVGYSAPQPLETPDASWSKAQLRIEYPHPDGRADVAKATLRLCCPPVVSQPAPSLTQRLWSPFRGIALAATQTPAAENSCVGCPQADDEIWVLEIPKQQLDLLLADLSGSGFFEAQTRPTADAKLSVKIDYRKTSKNWTSEPKLNDMAARVYRNGWIDGFVSPAEAGVVHADGPR